ncbi:DNA polymerase III subunit delta' [Exilibacterium tricleocarpae]|uniref:DNA polymerase III subunit delta' n=1 Tax=Exilibacterium tricleocarpae TaxID=2591008 RepID=A0A545T8D8_9GAMM|nr:DNA polymerase III subunit delta' [Exilibacterium tricleocarpae]TQV73492.1 DNA polymerase III subunit delta' [Exilibacterium tricleocarpae]
MTHTTETLTLPYPWQQPQWQQAIQWQERGKLPHALLLGGQQGIGKAHFAAALAQYLLCAAPRSGLACGDCRGCELNRAGTHPDLVRVQPEQAGKAIKVDQIRELVDFLAKTAQQGGMKLAVIAPAEAMNINAANALLKSLEEPAGDTLLLLVSHTPSRVLATIRSRCHNLPLATPTAEQAESWLAPLVKGEDPRVLLQSAGGAPLAALALVEGDGLERRGQLLAGLLDVAEGRRSALDGAASAMSAEPLQVLDWLLGWLQMGARQLAGAAAPMASGGDMDRLAPVFARIQPVHLYLYVDKLLLAKRQLLSGANPNKQLLLEEVFMDWGALSRIRVAR